MKPLSAATPPVQLPLTPAARRRAIAEVLEGRFSFSALDATRRDDATYWASPRNDMARGIYGEALREKERLDAAVDSVIVDEVRALRLAR